MRFALDSTDVGDRQSSAPSANSASKADLQWFPLQNHTLFSSRTAVATGTVQSNLIAWDGGASRFYVWNYTDKCLHRLTLRLGEPDPSSVIAAAPSKVMRPDIPFCFEVNKIGINRNGSALFLFGLEGLRIMYLYGRTSVEENATMCRTVSIGSDIYFDENSPIRILQIYWNPNSDTHLGILSSDSVFRIFDLSTDLGKPEQEYYLQPVELGMSANAAVLSPVDFSFGGDHLWDKFSVFVLFSDGSVYVICPVVPFGSVYKWESILEVYNDALTVGPKSSDPKAVDNSKAAISWLESTFPDIVQQSVNSGKAYVLKAQPYVLLNHSVSLQGPLRNVYHNSKDVDGVKKGSCEGRAVSFLYNLVGKDSILVTAWSSGQLQLDALADEIHPVWHTNSAPRILFSSTDQILGAAMICETFSPSKKSGIKLDDPQSHTIWLGHPPPLLSLAIVELDLSKKPISTIAMIADPLVPERIFCIHAGGIDLIILHFLPFTNEANNKMRPPSVVPVLSTGTGDASPPPLCDCVALWDSFGSSWIVGITSLNDCVVLQMETWNVLLTEIGEKARENLFMDDEEETETSSTVISKELLIAPKPILLPASATSSRHMNADSIEGRSLLHQYFKLFHENYVEYAHKVYFELQHHGPHVKKMIGCQKTRLREMQKKLCGVDEKQGKIEDRIEKAMERHASLEERLQKLRNFPSSHKQPLSKAEQDFKSELDRITWVELDALHSAIEALRSRLKKHIAHSPQGKSGRLQKAGGGDDVSRLKSSLEKLSLLNSENSKKVKLIETSLRTREVSD